MVVCPIALAIGCRRCPIFSVCPVKTTIGDYVPPTPHAAAAGKPAGKTARSAKAKPAAGKTAAAGEEKRRSSRRRPH